MTTRPAGTNCDTCGTAPGEPHREWCRRGDGWASPAAPDTTGGELREVFSQLYALLGDRTSDPYGREWQHRPLQLLTDAVLALPEIRDLLAERDTLAAQVQAVEGLAEAWDTYDDTCHSVNRIAKSIAARALRRALGTPTTGGGDDERDKLRAQVRAVANLHRPYADGESQCVACSADCRYCESDHLWPCATARALGLPTTP